MARKTSVAQLPVIGPPGAAGADPATADQILADAGHTGRLQIQISENVPLDRWQLSFPIIAEAIEAFGKP